MEAAVSIIILNWNGWKDTINCLESVFQINYPHYHVIVIDNGSQDDSIEKIRDFCRGTLTTNSTFFTYNSHNKPISLIEISGLEFEQSTTGCGDALIYQEKALILVKNPDNLGFSRANNIGMKYAIRNLGADYVLLLNNDTIVNKDSLNLLIDVALTDEKIGICSPKVLKMYDPRIIDSTGHVFFFGIIVDRGKEKIDQGQYDHQTNVIGAIAAAALYKKQMLQEIGLFNEAYVTMYEDADLSWRAYNSRWRAKFVPDAIVYHKRGASVKKLFLNRETELMYTEKFMKNVVHAVRYNASLGQKMMFFFHVLYILMEGLNNKEKSPFIRHFIFSGLKNPTYFIKYFRD